RPSEYSATYPSATSQRRSSISRFKAAVCSGVSAGAVGAGVDAGSAGCSGALATGPLALLAAASSRAAAAGAAGASAGVGDGAGAAAGGGFAGAGGGGGGAKPSIFIGSSVTAIIGLASRKAIKRLIDSEKDCPGCRNLRRTEQTYVTPLEPRLKILKF